MAAIRPLLQTGDSGEASITVGQSDTAQSLTLSAEDSFPAVLATSRMIALMEIAAARVMKMELQSGQTSVGLSIDVRHTAATPVGCTVRAVATYLGKVERSFRFNVEAFDEAGVIGNGEHTRAIVDTERLLAGAIRRKR
jgi:fluoroacetyl-CoA thioesterase